MIKKCLFPAAGYGTRFLPATKAVPKEMLPIITKPLLQYGVEEALSAGISNMAIVTGRGKRSIEDHFDNSFELESQLTGTAKEYYLEDDRWQYFSIFNQKLPEYIIEESYFLENTKGVVFEDDNLRYYVFIKDYLINGSISPLEMEQEKIKNVLLNKNKIEYLKQLEDELYQNGLALKKIKIY